MYTGYFSSMVEAIIDHISNFVACPGAQVYWWLRHRGCLAEKVNQLICHCFTLDQQQKVTKSKYIAEKGYTILDKADFDNIINAVAGEGIYNTTLELSDKEQRMVSNIKGYNAVGIMFGEAKEGAVDANNFSSSASITTIHSKNIENSKSEALERTLARLVYSIATCKATTNGSEEEMEDDSNYKDEADAGEETGIAIEGMQMLNRHNKEISTDSMYEDTEQGGEEEGGVDKGELDPDVVEV
jgi:hypothetical protein